MRDTPFAKPNCLTNVRWHLRFSSRSSRLYAFMAPFVKTFQGQIAAQHAKTSVCGLLSDVEHKNVESIAYRFGQSRLPLQGFIGWAEWDDEPLRAELISQVNRHLGQGDGVLVFDPSAFPKSGQRSRWVWPVSGVVAWAKLTTVKWRSTWAMSPERAIAWWTRGCTCPKNGPRIRRAWTNGVLRACRGFRTRHQLALEMLAKNGAALPGWIAGDDEMGRPYRFRRRLASLESDTCWQCLRTRRCVISKSSRQGPAAAVARPRVLGNVEAWSQALDDVAWQRIDVRDGSKGPLVVEMVKRRVVSRTHRRQQGDEELLVVIRYRDRDQAQVVKVDYYLSNAVSETPLWELARVAKAAHRIEECIQRSKSEAGLADYEVRHWTGWQHHQTLSLLATWFLERNPSGEKMDPCDHLATDSPGHRDDLTRRIQCGTMSHMLKERQKRLQRHELARFYHWKQRNQLAPLNLYKRQF